MKNIQFKYLPLFCIQIYISLHLIEEGYFGFPKWVQTRWGIPKFDMEMWLSHNYYFIFYLILGWSFYYVNEKKLLSLGLGILVWGFLNFLNHAVFSIIFIEYSPGLLSSFIFLLLFVLGLQKLKELKLLNTKLLLMGTLSGALYWILPIGSFLFVDIILLGKG
ncbi:MAG: HXXEE domain-containing protein [SAR324 cluster bacterium]|nr:HXXEE domain-containing protein [SAR324 cluster bacterium]